MRGALNRLAGILIFAALLVFAVLVGIEAASRLAGAGTQLGSIDYRSWWSAMSGWDPGTAAAATVLIGVGVVGLLLLLAELRPTKHAQTTEIGRAEHGRVLLRTRSIAPYLRGRVARQEYVRSSAPRVRVSGTAATVRDRPTTVRPWEEAEIDATRTAITQDLRRMGLEADTITIEPRAPSGRGTKQVR